jgi:hypothetical protein
MAQGNVFGYGTYMICDDGFRNVVENGRVIGFQLNMRLANYRGYILSQIEDIRISVDGESIPRDDIRFTIGGRTYTLKQMEEVVDNRWELRQIATVTCLKPGGLKAGEHEVAAEEHIRASYIPMVAVARLTKKVSLGS